MDSKVNAVIGSFVRRSYTVDFKIEVVEAVLNRHPDETVTEIRERYDVPESSLSLWTRQYRDGILTTTNAVAVSHRPKDTQGATEYTIHGKNFSSIEECTRYAVEVLGGITRKVVRHERVEI